MKYRGWISGRLSDEQVLKDLGVQVGTYVSDEFSEENGVWQNCELDREALRKLEKQWGRFVWGVVSL